MTPRGGGIGSSSRAEAAAAALPANGSLPERVLVGVDFGVPSVRALEWVTDYLLARALVRLVYVVDPAAGPAGPGSGDLIPTREVHVLEEQAGEHLEDLARNLPRGRVTTEVRVGAPARELVRAAGEWGADLVTVGLHTHRGGPRRVLGSTAELLLGCSPVPVLLGERVRFSEPSRILAAVDGSPAAADVIRYAEALAREHRARLEVVDVFEDGRTRGVRAGSRVLETMEKGGADLLVIKVPTGRGRATFGGVARSILTVTPCPVLLVGGPRRTS